VRRLNVEGRSPVPVSTRISLWAANDNQPTLVDGRQENTDAHEDEGNASNQPEDGRPVSQDLLPHSQAHHSNAS